MVVLKASVAEGSFLGRGTHVWLEITVGSEKTSFSGSKSGRILRIYKNYRRDHDRHHERGIIIIPAPKHMTEIEWSKAVIEAGDDVIARLDKRYAFNGIWPRGKVKSEINRANCCTIVSLIIRQAGGSIPRAKLKGVVPGLWISNKLD